jgi:4-alpha-glucanotransferase
MASALERRSCGVLLHPTSLPGPYGIGDLGPEARRFADRLAGAGQRWWQMLPVGPVGEGNSPYDSPSSFAGNPLLLSLEDLAEDGLLDRALFAKPPSFREARVDYAGARAFKQPLIDKACRALLTHGEFRAELERFRKAHAGWLEHYARFHADNPELVVAAQFLFYRQWKRLRAHCEARGVELIGDVPIFVSLKSADVQAHPEIFHLDKKGRPTVVSGVPPDYFSETGQLWGTPLYRWDVLKEKGYSWWLARLGQAAERFHAVRLDHFIGFCRYWEIPAGSKTAVTGKWVPGPGAEFFKAVREKLPQLELIAEDLGAVSPEIFALRDQFHLPGMSVLHFGFEDVTRKYVVYTGTHDNDTTVGWYQSLPEEAKDKVRRHLGVDGSQIHWDLIAAALRTPADTAIIPAQDLLGLPTEARMNLPGTSSGNWEWRLAKGAPFDAALARLKTLTAETGRSQP